MEAPSQRSVVHLQVNNVSQTQSYSSHLENKGPYHVQDDQKLQEVGSLCADRSNSDCLADSAPGQCSGAWPERGSDRDSREGSRTFLADGSSSFARGSKACWISWLSTMSCDFEAIAHHCNTVPSAKAVACSNFGLPLAWNGAVHSVTLEVGSEPSKVTQQD